MKLPVYLLCYSLSVHSLSLSIFPRDEDAEMDVDMADFTMDGMCLNIRSVLSLTMYVCVCAVLESVGQSTLHIECAFNAL